VYDNDPFYDHCQLVQAVTNAGVQPPPAWEELRSRYETALPDNPQYPLRQRLAQAIINPKDGDDVDLLRAAVIAENFGPNTAFGFVRGEVLDELRRIYADVAKDTYAAVGAKFSAAVKRFTTAAEAAGDPEADAAEMLHKPDKARQAYLSCESYSNELTRLVPPLAAAMTLASGVDVHLSNQQLLLPLCVDVDGGITRRQLWTAWDVSTGRTQRWGALHAAGAAIRAHPLTEPLTEYRRALPVEQRRRQAPGQPHGILEYYTFDPEDDVEPIDPFRETGRMTVA
jgi:hypothetical protein